jgi:carbon-monoxide dehydrogenase medium subunit
MHDFGYHRPGSVDEAAKILAGKSDPKLLAGGMSLLPTLKLRLAQVSDIVDLSALDAIKGVERDGNTLVIGAMTRHYDVATSETVIAAIPAVAGLAAGIGDPLVRNRGTIGGSIANNDPNADYPSAVLALGATVVTNKRKIAADDFFKGLFETALEDGEIIIALRFPIPQTAAYVKYPNPASRFALVGAFVAKTDAGARVAVTGAGPCVFRLTAAETALNKNFTADAVDNIKVDPTTLNSDIHASAEYRAHVVAVMLKRAVAIAVERLSKGAP